MVRFFCSNSSSPPAPSPTVALSVLVRSVVLPRAGDLCAELRQRLRRSLAHEREIQVSVGHPDVFSDAHWNMGTFQYIRVPNAVIPKGIMLGDLYERGREAGMVLGEDRGGVRLPRILITKIAVAHLTHIGGRH